MIKEELNNQKQKAVLWTSVTSTMQTEEGKSLLLQKQQCLNYANAHKIDIVKHYENNHTLSSHHKKDTFNSMLLFIKENKEISTVLMDSKNRIPRLVLEGYFSALNKLNNKVEFIAVGEVQ